MDFLHGIFTWVSTWLTEAGYAMLAAIGGLLGHVMREHDRGNSLNWVRAAFEAASSGFIGILVMMACFAVGLSPLWSGFIVGIFGWLGADASIRVIDQYVYRKWGIKLRANTDKRVEAALREEEDNAR